MLMAYVEGARRFVEGRGLRLPNQRRG